MTNTKQDLQDKFKAQLLKAISHLEKSYKKSLSLTSKLDGCSDDDLEVWESFTARFARVVDIYLTKYLKLFIKTKDPGFDGTLIDYLNFAEKLNLLDSAVKWLSFREYRNIQTHDYTDDSFQNFVEGLRKHAPDLIKIKEHLK